MIQVHEAITDELLIDACRRAMTTNENPGFCNACGEEAESVEPDAKNFQCEHCEEKAVFGIEELVYIVASKHETRRFKT